MSYCYGCKQTIQQFNDSVANCQAETRPEISARTATHDDDDPSNDAVIYSGNIDASCNVSATGTDNWAGLLGEEQREWRGAYDAERERYLYDGDTSFDPLNWAGIDCSGLVEKAVNGARDAAANLVIDIPPGPGETGSQGFFDNDSYVFLSTDTENMLKKGDLVRSRHHISIMHSDEVSNGEYNIIHAYGINYYDDDGDEDTQPLFSRKVIVTEDRVINATGYGRIKLWN